MQAASSLFNPPASSPLTAAVDWINGTLFGSVAVSLCVLAVAFLGFTLMSGRLDIRDGLRVLIGCFLLLGASAIVTGLRDAVQNAAPAGPIELIETPASPAPSLTPQPAYNPYTGAAYHLDRRF